MVEEDAGEEDDGEHDREGGRIIGEGAPDEPLVLIVPEWSDRHLLHVVHMGVADAAVVHHELEDAVHVGQLEAGRQTTVLK